MVSTGQRKTVYADINGGSVSNASSSGNHRGNPEHRSPTTGSSLTRNIAGKSTTSARRNEHALANRKSASESDDEPHPVVHRTLTKIRHYGFLSRHSKISIDEVRAAIIESLRDIEPDLEFEDWTPPTLFLSSRLHSSEAGSGSDDGPKCPTCGGRLVFESFQRIRPPPLNRRDNRPRPQPEHSF